MTTDTSKYKFNHTNIRIKDPQASLKFYELLGMKMIKKLSFPENNFDLYFMAFDGPGAASSGRHWTDREGLIELTHNYGTENDPNFKVASGNQDPGKGFGHTCVSTDNMQAACQRLDDAGVKWQKKMSDGRMRAIAFILDPDGYWVELVGQNKVDDTEGVKETNLDTYRMNHTMIRVKDAQKTMKFYEDNFGMTLKRTLEMKEAQFNLYFMGYGPEKSNNDPNKSNPNVDREGLLELTWNYGTENDPKFKYHDGNTDPKGFGHICVSVDDLEPACERLEKKGVNFSKKLTDGNMKDIAFVTDPDGYKIEIIQNEKLKHRKDW